MKTTEYLDAARRKIGAESNADVARALGLSRAALTKYYNGERIIDDYTAARLAEVLGVDPLKVIAQANAEREKDSMRAAYWLRMAAAFFLVAGVNLLLSPSTAEAAPVLKTECKVLYYVKSKVLRAIEKMLSAFWILPFRNAV